MTVKTSKLIIAGVGLTALVLSGCTPPGDSQDDAGGQAITVGWNAAPWTLNPNTSTGSAVTNAVVTYMMNDNFVHYDDQLELQKGALGEMRQVAEDPLAVAYTFADTAQWSDGTPVDAADLVLQWAATSGSFNTAEATTDADGAVVDSPEGEVYFDAGRLGPQLIEEFPEISEDGGEVTFTYAKTFSDWQTSLGLGGDGVGVPAHIVGKKALGLDDPAEAKQAIMDAVRDEDADALSKIANVWNTGFDFTSLPSDPDLLVHSGPFAMTAYEEGQYMVLERDPEYTGPIDPRVDTITFRYNEDPMAMVQAIENGEVDITQPQATADVRQAVEEIDGVELLMGDDASFEHVDLTFDNNGPFDPASYGGDEDTARQVRQAFLAAIPREGIVERIIAPLQDGATTRDSFMAVPGSGIYQDVAGSNGAQEALLGDPEAAKAMLAEAGVESPTVRILYGADNQRRAQQFQLIREAAEAAGFEIVDEGDNDWGTRLADGTYDAAIFAWQPLSTAVTENDAYYRGGQQYNYGGYQNDDVDALMDDLVAAGDEASQAEVLTEIEQILFQDGYGAPLFQHPALVISSERVQNVSLTSVLPGMAWNYWEWETA